MGDTSQTSSAWHEGLQPFDQLLLHEGSDPEVSCDHRDIQCIMYTSGTTGPSKGVIMPNGHFFASAMVFLRALGLTAEDILFTPLPLFHGLASRLGVLPCLMVGAQVSIAPRFSTVAQIVYDPSCIDVRCANSIQQLRVHPRQSRSAQNSSR
ncbi:MAG: AMP-binding protein [Burkholderiaceae bacterium]